jgi:hypothetical protein
LIIIPKSSFKKEIMDKMAERNLSDVPVRQSTWTSITSLMLGIIRWIDWFFTLSNEDRAQAGINLDGEGHNSNLEILESASSDDD